MAAASACSRVRENTRACGTPASARVYPKITGRWRRSKRALFERMFAWNRADFARYLGYTQFAFLVRPQCCGRVVGRIKQLVFRRTHGSPRRPGGPVAAKADADESADAPLLRLAHGQTSNPSST
jgi:hypothetical protein